MTRKSGTASLPPAKRRMQHTVADPNGNRAERRAAKKTRQGESAPAAGSREGQAR